MGQVKRTTYKYLFKVGNRIKHVGFTSDLSRRERELRRGTPKGHIKGVGRRTTREAARRWTQDNR
jgi:hypothetical protein